MPKKSFAFGPKEPARLEITWTAGWKNLTAEVDGQRVLSFVNVTGLKAGAIARLEDGRELTIRLRSQLFGSQLEVLLDGAPLTDTDPDTETEPEARVSSAAQVLYVIAGFSIGFGLLAELGQIKALLEQGMGWFSVATGVVYAGLGASAKRQSKVALTTALILFTLDTLLLFGFSLADRNRLPVGAVIMRVVFLGAMLRGLYAMSEIERRRRRTRGEEPKERPTGVLIVALLNCLVGAWLAAWSLISRLGSDSSKIFDGLLGAPSPLILNDTLITCVVSLAQIALGLGLLSGREGARVGFLLLAAFAVAFSVWPVYQAYTLLETFNLFDVGRAFFFLACARVLMASSAKEYFSAELMTPVDDYRPWMQ
ncbi:MAG: hypothetical protein AAF657_14370 [Acidobacteriota bacterium]